MTSLSVYPSHEAPDSASPANFFPQGMEWVRADFHLHTRADKEFSYSGTANSNKAAALLLLEGYEA